MKVSPRLLFFKLHSYLSVAIGLYVAILGITGAILAFNDDILRLAHPTLFYVTPAPPRLSFAAIGAALGKAYPGQPVGGYILGKTPDRSILAFVGPGITFVNPYTGKVLGSIDQQSDPVSIALDKIESIHLSLAPHGRRDARARSFVSWINVATLVLVLSGIWLWFPRMRFGIGAGGGRRFWYDVHASLGIAAALFLIVLCLTAAAMSFDGTINPLLYAVTGSKPTPQPKIPPPPAGGQPLSIDDALAIGAKALPGARPTTIFLEGGAYTIGARTSRDPTTNGWSWATVDRYTGKVLASELLGTAPAGSRLLAWNGALHKAEAFGMPGKVIFSLASPILALQVVSGAMMWIKRASLREMIPALVAATAVAGVALYALFVPGG